VPPEVTSSSGFLLFAPRIELAGLKSHRCIKPHFGCFQIYSALRLALTCTREVSKLVYIFPIDSRRDLKHFLARPRGDVFAFVFFHAVTVA
jgi:hypothetical protein